MSVLESHSLLQVFSCLWHVARSLCICRTSCLYSCTACAAKLNRVVLTKFQYSMAEPFVLELTALSKTPKLNLNGRFCAGKMGQGRDKGGEERWRITPTTNSWIHQWTMQCPWNCLQCSLNNSQIRWQYATRGLASLHTGQVADWTLAR